MFNQMVHLISCNIRALEKSLHRGPKFLWVGLNTGTSFENNSVITAQLSKYYHYVNDVIIFFKVYLQMKMVKMSLNKQLFY